MKKNKIPCSVSCFYCGCKPFRTEKDHFPIPNFAGGRDTVNVCPNCHLLKDSCNVKYLQIEKIQGLPRSLKFVAEEILKFFSGASIDEKNFTNVVKKACNQDFCKVDHRKRLLFAKAIFLTFSELKKRKETDSNAYYIRLIL